MDACWDDRSKWEIYNEKIHKRAHSVHNSKVIRTGLARGNIFENVRFPIESRQNLPFIEKYATLFIYLHTVKWFQVLLCITNYSIQYQSFSGTQLNDQTVLFDPLVGPKQALPLWIRVNLCAMAMKEYSTLPKTPGQEPHHQMQFNFISKTLVGGGSIFCWCTVAVFYSPSSPGCLN